MSSVVTADMTLGHATRSTWCKTLWILLDQQQAVSWETRHGESKLTYHYHFLNQSII